MTEAHDQDPGAQVSPGLSAIPTGEHYPDLDAASAAIAERLSDADWRHAGKVSGTGDGPMEAAMRIRQGQAGLKIS
ncbi:MAG: hypothetical protein Q8P62_04010 [Candidatus Peregrinibacteria bacterium]|nr:hypothetical protein [Candidatus Peregrinibacteria bacterium]